jgi:hypothetical protein
LGLARHDEVNMSALQSEIDELRARLARLEAGRAAPGGHTNQAGAARYLGRSEEWLRQLHASGEGPPRTQEGRYWIYSYANIDRWVAERAAKSKV